MLTDHLTLGKSNNRSIIPRVVIWPSLSLPRFGAESTVYMEYVQ
jgi:hypothetical protein